MSALSVVVFLCLGSQFVSYVLCAPRLLIFQPSYFSLTYDESHVLALRLLSLHFRASKIKRK